MLQEAVRNAAGRRLRILEIGGGHGVLTGEILPVLAEANVEYYFTDLGRGFVVAARAAAEERGLNFIKFQTLDITEPPAKTGLEPESFDLILGLDVVHATPNITKTLSNLRLYLRPGGSLALLETLRVARWNEMIFGLTEGWWYFEDPEIRIPGSPILSIDGWLEALKETGYAGIEAWPNNPEWQLHADSGMLLARKPGRIEALRELGSQVVTEAADVADPAGMARVEALAIERFGGIDGILHCAAVDDQGSIQWKTPRFEEREFAPKIRGTEVLEGIVERTQPSIFLLCSSLNTATGGPGQIGYCAANAFLDAYAHSRAGRGPARTVAVNWDRWQGIGMASAFEDWTFRRTGRKLEGGMTVAQGLAILDRILWAETPAQVIVSKAPPAAPRSVQEPPQASIQNEPKPEPVARSASNPPVGHIETVIASVFESTLGGGPIGRDDNFTELGGDSLIAIQVASRLREELRVELPLRSIFENPTVAALAEAVANRRWAAEAASAETEMEEGVI
jgi:SAM-dependent methyltransferase/acyl carrier protein